MSIRTTHSTLMHAALAYVSPQLRTFDSIITLHSRHNRAAASPKTILSLPTEILLLIRFYLLPIIIDHLRTMSATAQSQYESSIRSYLCNECIAYNEEIFGQDVWEWAPFSGPCGCIEAGKHSPTPIPRRDEPTSLNVKEFTNPHQWLESHLSGEALQLVGSLVLLSGPHNPTAIPIWNLVHKVLRDLGCESLRGKISSTPFTFASATKETQSLDTSGKGALSRWDCRSKTILVVPMASALRQAEQGACPNDRTPTDSAWRRDVILKRVERELGLSFEYPEVIEPPAEREELPFPLIRAPPNSASSQTASCSPPFISPIKARLLFLVKTLYAILSAPSTMRIF